MEFRGNSSEQAAAFNFRMNLLASQRAQKQKLIIIIWIVSKTREKTRQMIKNEKWRASDWLKTSAFFM